MAVFGSLALLLALALAIYQLLAGGLALWLRGAERPSTRAQEQLAGTARGAGVAGFAALTAAVCALLWLVFANDFSIPYVAEHSSRALPVAYKVSVLWSWQEGSLLLWAWLLAAYGFVLWLRRKRDEPLYTCAGTVLAGVQLFFLAVLNFAAPPFVLLPGPIPGDGEGLNPLLQYPEMLFHPPLLYLGYVGFAVPFAIALAALWLRIPDERWIGMARRWTLLSWLFLTAGIFLGMHWAYAVLGWGGYWSWDPVENASLMPWLTSTAFLHTAMAQEKRGMMKRCNVWLIFATFLLTLLGTLLARGGLVSSVHAFAASPIGYWFLTFLLLALAVCAAVYILRRGFLRGEQHVESLVSRESALLLGAGALLAACLVILWGTLLPLFSAWTGGGRVEVGAPFYNGAVAPIAFLVLFLAGAGPWLSWRMVLWKGLGRRMALPVLAVWITIPVCLGAGLPLWRGGVFSQQSYYALVAFALSAGVLAAMLPALLQRAEKSVHGSAGNGWGFFLSLRRRGGCLVHVGVALIMVGFAGAAFNLNEEKELAPNSTLAIGPYTLTCAGVTQDASVGYDSEYALLDVYEHSARRFQMTPEQRVYQDSGQAQSMAAIHSLPGWDLYVEYEGVNSATGQPVIKAWLNPLVSWIWAGALLMMLGALIALLPGCWENKKKTVPVK